MSYSMNLPVTQWFEGTPPTLGVWEVAPSPTGQRYFAYWDAWNGWSTSWFMPEVAFSHRDIRAFAPPFRFRGLAIKPDYFPTSMPTRPSHVI